jgi:hypothetical protein
VIDRLLAAGSDLLLLISVFQILEQVSTVSSTYLYTVSVLCCDNIHSGGFLLLLLFYCEILEGPSLCGFAAGQGHRDPVCCRCP